MSTTPAARQGAQAAIARIRSDEAREQIQAALPPSVSIDRFTRATATALIQNPDLAGTDEASLFQAIVKCAQDGLFPDGREAALVVYKGKAQYLPMIAGVRKIAAEYGWTIVTHVVYANDVFDVQGGTDDRITHRPVGPGEPRGDLVAAYAVAHHRDGRRSITEVMHAQDIAKARAVAQTDRIWNQWPAQMFEKTVGHRIAKKLPLDPQDAARLNRVITAADLAPGEAAEIMYGPHGPVAARELPQAEQPEGTDGTDGTDGIAAPENEFGAADDDTDDLQAATAAAGYIVTVPTKTSWVNGLTLAQINARGDDGQTFFRWALKQSQAKAANHDDALRTACAAYAKARLPFLSDEFSGGQA